MNNKDVFVKAIERFEQYREKKEKKNKLLEQAFGSDTTIFDFDGLEEILGCVVDLGQLIFTAIPKENLEENISWYVYEASGMDEPIVSESSDDDDGKKWVVNSPEVLYDMLSYFNSQYLNDYNSEILDLTK